VPCQQARLVAEALGSQTWPGKGVEPVIEILTNGLSGRTDVATKISLLEHAVVVAFSIFVQGLTIAPLLRRIGGNPSLGFRSGHRMERRVELGDSKRKFTH